MNLSKIFLVVIRYNAADNPTHLEAFDAFGKSLFVLNNLITLEGGQHYMKVISFVHDDANNFLASHIHSVKRYYRPSLYALPFGLS